MKINFYGATILLSEKSDGNMKNNGENILKFLRNSGLPDVAPYVARLNHGNKVGIVPTFQRESPPECDSLITNKRGIMLGVGFADCPTVFVIDPYHMAYGIAHCGWKGLKAGVIGNMLGAMKLEYNTDASKCFAYVGPGIEQACYEIGPEVAKEFAMVRTFDGKHFLNLRETILRDLGMNGIGLTSYTIDCTFCDIAPSGEHKYFSGRRDKLPLEELKTNMAFIVIQ